MKKIRETVWDIAKILLQLSPVVTVAWSLIILTELYVASDLPKHIFIVFWVFGAILIMIKTASVNWLNFAKKGRSEQ